MTHMAENETQSDDLSVEQLERLADEVTQPEEPLTPESGDVNVNIVNTVNALTPPEPNEPDAPTPPGPNEPDAPTPPGPNEPDESGVTALDVARTALMEAEKALDAAQVEVKEALAHRNECSSVFGKLREAGKLSLHELNQQQKSITRVENSRRFRAQEALNKMVGHYRPGKRDNYPLSPSAKAAVGDAEE